MSKNWLKMLKNVQHADQESRIDITSQPKKLPRVVWILSVTAIITVISFFSPLYNPVEPLILILLMLLSQPIIWVISILV